MKTSAPVTAQPAPVPHAFTVDTEDWAALMCMYLGHDIPASRQFTNATYELLDLLDEHAVKATFYVVASQARQQPQVVREIVKRGHELGSHGWTHLQNHTFTPDSYRKDIRQSVDALQQLAGQPIHGHRCPFFSLLPGQQWALEAMVEAGLKYDSSMTNLVWAQAGRPMPERPFLCNLPGGGSIVEFPAPARKLGPLTARYIGGRGLRNLPRSFTLKHMREREALALPGMVYLHTYEVMPDRLMRYVPREVGLPSRFKLAVAAKSFEIGLGHMRRSLQCLLSDFRWAPAGEVIAHLRAAERLPEVMLDAPQSGPPSSSD